MSVNATQDSNDDAAVPGDSSLVQFRVMYDLTKVYVLFEIYDDTWINPPHQYTSNEYKVDSLFICVNEDGNASTGNNPDNTYLLCGFVNPDINELTVRKNKGTNNGEKEYAVKVDGEYATVELSFELNNVENAFGNSFYFDVQYNDCDQQTYEYRTVVWNWSCKKDAGNGQIASAGNGTGDPCQWGQIYFGLDPNQITSYQYADAPAAESLTVDGVIDDAWDGADTYTLEVDAFMDSKGNPDTRRDSSKVEFRVMYSGDKVYMLFEIFDKDGDWKFGDGTHWKNDSLFIGVCEEPKPLLVTHTDIELCKIADSVYNEGKAYTFNVYPDTDTSKTASDLFFARKGTNDLAKEIAVKEVDAETRVVEISFELKNMDVNVGSVLYLDVQYNDADDVNNKEEGSSIDAANPRTIVWNWSTDCENGLSAGNAGGNWGRIEFVEAPVVDDGNQGGSGDGADGIIEVTTTDTYTWIDEYTFTADVSGEYTFNVPAGLGVWGAAEMEIWGTPYVDYQMEPNGGTFTKALAAGEEFDFAVGAMTRGDWVISYTVVEGEVGGDDEDDNEYNGFKDANGLGGEYTFTFVAEYTLIFNPASEGATSGTLTVVDPNSAQYSKTYDYAIVNGMYVLSLNGEETTEAVISQDPANWTFQNMGMMIPQPFAAIGAAQEEEDSALVVGKNNVSVKDEDLLAGAVIKEFAVTQTGDYTFRGDFLVQVADAEGNPVERNADYSYTLEAGKTYNLSLGTMFLGGRSGSYGLEITVVPAEDNVETGDATTALLVVSAVALLGTALVVGKKRRVQE